MHEVKNKRQCTSASKQIITYREKWARKKNQNFFFAVFCLFLFLFTLFHLSNSMRKVCCCWNYTSQRKIHDEKTKTRTNRSKCCLCCVTWAKHCLGIRHSLSLISWPTFGVKCEKEWLNGWFSLISLFRWWPDCHNLWCAVNNIREMYMCSI